MTRGHLVLVAVACAAAFAFLLGRQPHFLAPKSGGRWITEARPMNLLGRAGSDEVRSFKLTAARAPDARNSAVEIQSLGGATVFVDGAILHSPSADEKARGTTSVRLDPAAIANARGGIEIVVERRSGHPCLLVSDATGSWSTGPGWAVSSDRMKWTPAAAASDPLEPVLPDTTAARAEGIVRCVLTVVLACFLAVRLAGSSRPITDKHVRWVRNGVIGVIAVLCAHNLFSLPAHVGFDLLGHVDYVRTVARDWRIPLADEGWERLQPPLFYVASAPIAWLCGGASDDTLVRALRIVPMLCCVIQPLVLHRCARLAAPDRQLTQIAIVVVGALLPAGLYVSQTANNEPLAGLLGSLVCLFLLKQSDGSARPWRALGVVGALIGLALLTKASTLALLPCALFVLWTRRPASVRPLRAIAGLALVVCALLVVCGWYYWRNWTHFGVVFIGGWDWASTGIEWWQDPSYVTLHDFVRFGSSVAEPLYAARAGFWDGLFAGLWTDTGLSGTIAPVPPWNYAAVRISAGVGLVLTGFGVVGIVRAWKKDAPDAARVSLVIVCVTLTSIACLYATLPMYSSIKATYALCALPAMAITIATGMDVLLRAHACRVLWFALLGVFAGLALQSYWA